VKEIFKRLDLFPVSIGTSGETEEKHMKPSGRGNKYIYSLLHYSSNGLPMNLRTNGLKVI